MSKRGQLQKHSMKSVVQVGLKEMTSGLKGNPFQNQVQIQNKCVNKGKRNDQKGMNLKIYIYIIKKYLKN